MAPVRARQSPVEQVRECLAEVMDPELDESVLALGFVTGIGVTGAGEVSLNFRLPTYWCAANFAFLMADDMRRAVAALPWVSAVAVNLQEHMYAQAINEGVARGAGFQAAFADAAGDDLEGLRRTFLLKAFQRRQQALLEHLLEAGHAAAALVGLELAGLRALALDEAGATLLARYLARRAVVGGAPRAFVDTEGQVLPVDGLAAHLRELRRVGVNAEFNGALCRGLLAVREPCEAQPIHIVRRQGSAPAASASSAT